MEGMEHGVHTLYITDQAIVKEHDETFSGRRRNELMERTGRRNPDVAFVKSMRCVVNNDSVFLLEGHNDFQCCMPVDRIVFSLFVVIQLKTVKSVVCNCLVNSVQYFNHVRDSFVIMSNF